MWGKCRDNITIEYKERLRARYEELSKEVEEIQRGI